MESQFRLTGLEKSSDHSNVTAHLELANKDRFRAQISGTIEEKNALFKYMKHSGEFATAMVMVEHDGWNDSGFPINPNILHLIY